MTKKDPALQITDEHLAHWREHGYVLVDDVLTQEEVEAAKANLAGYVPSWKEFAGAPNRYPQIRSSSMVKAEFPFLDRALNEITTHSEITGAAERILDTPDIHLAQSIFWVKFARTHDYAQELHLDYQNNTLTFPSDDPRFQQLPLIVYYEDVSEEDGPTYVVSRRHSDPLVFEVSHARDPEEGDLAAFEKFNVPFLDRDEYAAVYEHEIALTPKAGSVLLFSMATFHRGSAIRASSGRRLSHHIVYRRAGAEWMGWLAWPRRGADPEMREFIQVATPRQLELIGFPGPGHPFWTEETLAGIALRYPRMDLGPYRAALADSPAAMAGTAERA
jgi:ectoine hydroxylase-related dioxygenase (phytanoyl-CoA dioxygenase family)